MKSLKVNLEENASFEKLTELLIQIKGIKSVEIIDDENAESDLKKAFAKSKEQLKKGEYENIVNDIFDILIQPKSK
ncbi:hypothetical protein CBW16_02780 [Flavobacteriaceae bacterium JJC]|uniref:hypothetical protein n=1 Tax=Kaistella soli TaxID=2849654 RepID=UPI000B4B63CD|nr:hypothetical protein [Kaistella soli]MBU8881492.1 hypothetical protein [Kaistella soli]OWK74353.1 hypothetical protein CBW16_02780 [Flavobacteriaceae bacterium JJC]